MRHLQIHKMFLKKINNIFFKKNIKIVVIVVVVAAAALVLEFNLI